MNLFVKNNSLESFCFFLINCRRLQPVDYVNVQSNVKNNSSKNPIYSIVGPTASGKTEIGVALALYLGNAEIINCDSVQIYQGIEIATAKPSAEEMRGVKHHLIDYVSPNTNYTAADWAKDAAEKIEEIEARGNIPILVGGTGFYLRTLRDPLFESPKTDRKLREKLTAIKDAKGAEHLHKILQKVDPASAAKFSARLRAFDARAGSFFKPENVSRNCSRNAKTSLNLPTASKFSPSIHHEKFYIRRSTNARKSISTRD